GERREDLSAFYVPNRYAAALAQRFPDRLEWICSIHPYRADAIDKLQWSVRQGARAVKWLPSATGMDPASPKCDPFYQALTRFNLPWLPHGGEEQAVASGATAEIQQPAPVAPAPRSGRARDSRSLRIAGGEYRHGPRA